jgi:hypothetical protein
MRLIYYVALHESPRSLSLPKYFNAKYIRLLLNANLWSSFNKKTVNNIKEEIINIPARSVVIVEYDGNFIIPLILIYISISQNKKWKVILDAHVNSYISTPMYRFSGLAKYLLLSVFSLFRSTYVLVHNKQSKIIIPWSVYCPTPFPEKIQGKDIAKNKNILIISSLNKDEPVELFIDFAKDMRVSGFDVKITGDFKKIDDTLYKNNHEYFTGYLDKNSYNKLILESNLIIAMTKRKFNLLYAPREAIVNNKKCMINDSVENFLFYGDACIYSSLDKRAMIEKVDINISQVLNNSNNLINDVDKEIYKVKEWLLQD